MEHCENEDFLRNGVTEKNQIENNTWKPLIRQSIICIGIWYIYFIQGIYLGAPTVLIAQLRREANSTQAVTDEMSSWLSSMPTISSLPQMFIFSWLFHRVGRKFTHLIVCIVCSISSIFFYVSTKFEHLLISQIFVGAGIAASSSFEPLIISEYTSPKYRGIFLTIKSVTPFWGIWVANSIGTFFYWKNIAIVSFVCSVYIITVFIWPESPYWLAKKGRYSECIESHRWLKGVNVNSEKELWELVTSQKQLRKNIAPSDSIGCLSKIWLTITSRQFYKPALICVLLFAQYHLTGKLVTALYAVEILKHLTKDESLAFKGMLILDGITVLSMYSGCILSRYFNRRRLLFSFAVIGNLFLYILSLYLCLISFSLLQENHIAILFLLSVFSITIGCGPMILASSIYGEIIPISYQNSITIIVGMSTITISGTLFKLSPYMVNALKMHGYFLFYAMSSTVVIIILYIHLPETKDKTIQEISNIFVRNPLPELQHQTLLQKQERE